MSKIENGQSAKAASAQTQKKEVKIIPMNGKTGRYIVVDLQGNVICDGNKCGFKSRVNAQRAVNKEFFKLVYDEETKAECAEYYGNKNSMRNFMYGKGLEG